eukprot:1185646-Prorocentrum_minimum.AAC.4
MPSARYLYRGIQHIISLAPRMPSASYLYSNHLRAVPAAGLHEGAAGLTPTPFLGLLMAFASFILSICTTRLFFAVGRKQEREGGWSNKGCWDYIRQAPESTVGQPCGSLSAGSVRVEYSAEYSKRRAPNRKRVSTVDD